MSAGSGGDHAATRVIHAGHAPADLLRTVGPPVQKGSTVLVGRAADLYDDARPTYGRAGLATQAMLASALAELEGATTVKLYPSGLAAVAGAIIAVVKAGDEVLAADCIYKPVRRFCERVLGRFGVAVRYFPGDAAPEAVLAMAGPATRLLVMESPGSLSFEMQDVPAIARLARERGLLTLLDNTWAAGLLFKPLDHGVDLSVQSLTKYVGGHSDVFMGAAATKTPEVARALERNGASGLVVAAWLADQPEVARVLHPALPGAQGHEHWRRDYAGAAGVFGVVLRPAPKAAVEAFLDALRLFGLGFSWGGFESLALTADPQFEVREFKPAFEGPVVRLNIGLEDPADLIADLRQGLDVFAAA
jgi:cystathionine beta-lyase